MKRLVLVQFMALLMLTLEFSEASLLPGGRSRSKKLGDQKTREAPYVCLDASVDLPACNFLSEDDENTPRRSRSKRALVQLESMQTIDDPEELTQREFLARRYSQALTIVYKMEGCNPSRLPFHLPKCELEDTAGRIVEVRRLFPFTVTGLSKPDLEPPLVFPELDMDQWHRNMKGPWIRPINNKNEADVENSKVQFYEDQQSELKMAKVPKWKKFEHDEMMEKKKLLKKIIPRHERRETRGNDILSKYSSSFLAKQRMTDHRASDANSYKAESSRANSPFDHDENLRRVVENDSTSEYHHEFPYAEAIPYDPEKLQMARQGSEFPYARAIPYDPKKLAERRGEMIEASKSSSPFYSRRLKFVETRSADFRDDVPFDASMIDAAKDGGIFPYVKEIPADTSKTLHPRESQRSREPEKIKVPVRHVMRFWRVEIPITQRKLRSIDEKKVTRKNILKPENENEISEFSALSRRLVRSPIESSTSDVSSVNDGLEIPRRWSEFPYSRAIPFDPEKLRHPRSTMEHRAGSLHEVPRDFPYSKAIPYDSWKLVAFRRKKNQSPNE